MSTDRELAALWTRLTETQRTYLMEQSRPHRFGQRSAVRNFVATGRALKRQGLLNYAPGPRLSPEATALAHWALAQGYAERTDEGWRLSVPSQPPRRQGRIDEDRLRELVAAGVLPGDIAAQLGVSRQGVHAAAQRLGLTLPRKSKKVRPVKAPRVIRPHRLAFMVSADELAAVQSGATAAGLTVSDYIRREVFADAARGVMGKCTCELASS